MISRQSLATSGGMPSGEQSPTSMPARSRLIACEEVVSSPGSAVRVTRLNLTAEGRAALRVPARLREVEAPRSWWARILSR